jgi:hypothetical protein
MYALTNIDFSKPLGIVVSELLPELEFGRQNASVHAKTGWTLRDHSPVASPASELDRALAIAVFGAA